MNLLFSCIGKRGYIADYFRPHLGPDDQIVATSNSKWTSGFVACDIAKIMPDIVSDNYHAAVLELCQTHSIRGAFSFFDPDVVRLAQIRQQLMDIGVVPVLPELKAAEICFDKYLTFQFLTEQGFATPLSFVRQEDALQALARGELSYPLVVKPRSGFGSRATFVAHNDRELEVFFNYEPSMLIQQFIAGDAYDFDICSDLDGNPLSVVVWRKLRSTLGETEYVVTCKDQRIMDEGIRLGECLKNIGPMDVDLFVTDSRIYVLEMNPRFGGGYPASQLAGADFPGIVMKMIRGEKVASQMGNYQADVAMVKTVSAVGGNQKDFWRQTMHLDQPVSDGKGG